MRKNGKDHPQIPQITQMRKNGKGHPQISQITQIKDKKKQQHKALCCISFYL